jgi:uncharacterized membrane protein YfcA
VIPVLAVAAGALAQAVTGIGFALVAAPFLVAFVGPREGVRTVILLSAVLNAVVLAREHRAVLVVEGSLLLVPAVALTPLLAWATARIDGRVLAVVAGALTVASAAALGRGLRLERARNRGAALAAGALSAVMNVVAGIGGPAAALYAVNAGWPGGALRATLQAYFLVLNAVALASLGLPALPPELLAGLVAGWAAGVVVAPRVDERGARSAALLLAAAGGVVAVVRALP